MTQIDETLQNIGEPFRFLDLPGEIRNEVYSLLVVQDDPISLYTKNVPILPALTRVNRQVRNEARKVYYLQNTFQLRLNGTFNLSAYRKFIRKSGLEAEKISDNVTCIFDYYGRKIWTKHKVDFMRMVRQHYLYGGAWPKAVSFYSKFSACLAFWPSEINCMAKVVEMAENYKEEGMKWMAAKEELLEALAEEGL